MNKPIITTKIPIHFSREMDSPKKIQTANAVMAGIILQKAFALVTPIILTT